MYFFRNYKYINTNYGICVLLMYFFLEVGILNFCDIAL